MSDEQVRISSRLEDLRNDFTVLQATPRQYEGQLIIAELIANILGLEKEVIATIIFKLLIQDQIEHQRYHFEMEQMSPYIRTAAKGQFFTLLRNQLKRIVLEKDYGKIDQALDKMTDYYLRDYLPQGNNSM